ncbi:terminase large subunit [Listeria booriae]|uniref:terminase large subunit n=1 Tax=Listeria booriae TaxID=1552123 RepID=UPI00164D89C8|nr:terminase TerL endonuclease subunit [Listeria booriae]MBC6133915.1 terminase large subunit [Listeria booriae]
MHLMMMTMTTNNHVKDSAWLYCQMVINGDLLASDAVIKTCQRHIDDLDRQGDSDFPYKYFPKRAKKFIKFSEMLPDPKTGETYPLAGFQKFIQSMLYGWYEVREDKRRVRRFKKAFISMARKNGKSILVAGIALYEFLFGKDPKMSRQIFCTANDKKQAKIIFDMIRKQLEALRRDFSEIKENTKRIREELKNLMDESFIMPLSRDTGAVDGFEPYIGILDEYAASKTTEMLELLESGQMQLENALNIIISTAGFNLNAPMYTEEYKYAKAVLEKHVIDEEYFCFIAEHDAEDEYLDEKCWIKSNPLLEVKSMFDATMKFLRKRLDRAIENQDLNPVLVKNFNMWRQHSKESYMDAFDWKAAEDKTIDIRRRKVIIGIDLSRGDDLTAVGFVYPLEEDKFHIDAHSFVATKGGLAAKEERDHINYTMMAENNYATITDLETGTINIDLMLNHIENHVMENELEIASICYDRAMSNYMIAEMEKRGWDYQLIDVAQGFLTLSEPTKQLRLGVIDKKITHSGNMLLTIAVNNAVLDKVNDAQKISKKVNREKIDPIIAVVNAWTEAMFYDETDGASFEFW